MRLHWHIHATGTAPDGRQFFVIDIEEERYDYSLNSRKPREFGAVLMLEDGRLWRLRPRGRDMLLAAEFTWDSQRRQWEYEHKLRPLVPQAWGNQHGSGCVRKAIPVWVLKRPTANPARLLLAWFRVDEAMIGERLRPRRTSGFPLSEIRSWDRRCPAPPAVTIIPSTDVVIRALNSGLLLQRLQRGLERIYVSEMALIRAPKHGPALIALAHRFPDRLIVAPVQKYDMAGIAFRRMTRNRAFEYAVIGYELRGQYLDDFHHDKWSNPHPDPFPDILLRVGDVPRGSRDLLWAHEWSISFETWATLDERGLKREAAKAELQIRGQTKRAQDALATALGNHERGNGA